MDTYINSYFEERMKRMNKISSPEYLKWLKTFTDIHTGWSDDSFYYDETISEEDKNNTEILSTFYDYVNELKQKQKVFFEIEPDDYFYEEKIFFEYDSNFYELSCLVGQGTITSIKKLEKSPENYVVLGRELSEKEKQEKSLVEIIIINDKYSNNFLNISNELVELGSLSFEKYQDTDIYNCWKQDKVREFYLASDEILNSLKDSGVFVADKLSDIIVLSLGIIPRKNISEIIKKLKKIN